MARILHRLVPDSLFSQILLVFGVGLGLLLVSNLRIIENMQTSYRKQTHEYRVGAVISSYFLLNFMTAEQRAETITRVVEMQSPYEGVWSVASSLAPGADTWSRGEIRKDVQDIVAGVEARIDVRKISPRPPVKARILRNAGEALEPYLTDTLARTDRGRFPLLEIAIRMHDGVWLSVIQQVHLDDSRIVWMQRLQLLVLTLVFAAALALVMIRVYRPMRALGQAVEKFGRQPEAMQPLPEVGTAEARNMVRTFNRMRRKICENLTERDRMLAALAHDLRTPLTRIQLRLESVEPEALRDRLMANCAEVQSIVSHGMELARSLHTSEAIVPLDIVAFLQSIVDDNVAAGNDVVLCDAIGHDDRKILVQARPLCFRRCIDNLLNNALRYGERAQVRLLKENGTYAVEILDEGPGIPEEELASVSEPYYRLETSRNRNSGGTGLGLSISRNMAILNGTMLTLHNRPEGGLNARLSGLREWCETMVVIR